VRRVQHVQASQELLSSVASTHFWSDGEERGVHHALWGNATLAEWLLGRLDQLSILDHAFLLMRKSQEHTTTCKREVEIVRLAVSVDEEIARAHDNL
jgi:hypothetical protein